MEDVVQSTVRSPFECDDFQRLLDDEDSRPIATAVTAEGAQLPANHHLTLVTILHLRLKLRERAPERFRRCAPAPEQMERQAFGGLRPDAWELRKLLNGPFYGGGKKRHWPPAYRENAGVPGRGY